MPRPGQPSITPAPASTPTRLRPVDLARLCGVSTQQIRNYEEAGVLPPVPRTGSGYRVFGDAHRRALLTYRALSKGYGAGAATRIMRTVHEGDVPGALALVDAAHAALHTERVSLRATSEALETLAGEPPEDDVPGTDLLIGEVAALLGVRTSTLRVWEAAGLLSPRREHGTGYRHYTPEEVRDARFILALRRNHYLLDHIRPVLESLRHEGSTEALHAAITTRHTALTTRTAAMLEGAGHLHAYLTRSDDAPSAPSVVPSAPSVVPSAPSVVPSAPSVVPSAPSVPSVPRRPGPGVAYAAPEVDDGQRVRR